MSYKILVIDISKYQKNIDFAKVKKAGVRGVIIRAGYRGYGSAGTLVTDPYFFQNVKGCEDVGLPWGVYFFSQAKNGAEGVAEAEYTLSLLEQAKPAKPSFPVYIDTEYSGAPLKMGRADKISKSNRTAAVVSFCNTIEAAGYFAGVYASTTWFNTMVDDKQLTRFTHWVAHYAANCGYLKSHGMWQYSSDGNIPGISGRVDVTECYIDFPTKIKNGGFNGFTKDYKPQLFIFSVEASKGDIEKFKALAEELEISKYQTTEVK